MQSRNTQQSIFVIAGMHRSGTSLVAALLQSAGIDIGQRLMAPSENNAKGHFEDLDFVEFHEHVLYSHGISKDGWTLEQSIHVQEQYLSQARQLIEQNAAKETWGWKDPRTTLFLQFWADLIPDANFLLIYRSPWEVIDSLYRRGDDLFYSNPNFALELWIHYNQTLLNFYHQCPERCILFNLETIARDPAVLIRLLNQKFGTHLSPPADEICDPSLFRAKIPSSQRQGILERYFQDAIDLYSKLNAIAPSPDDVPHPPPDKQSRSPDYKVWALQDWLDIRRLEREQTALENELQKNREEVEQLHSRLYQSQLKTEQAHAEIDTLRNTIASMESTKFWQLREKWFQLKRALGFKSDE